MTGVDDGVLGSWALTIRTPVGSMAVVMSFVRLGGILTGTAEGNYETVTVNDLVVEPRPEGVNVRWSQRITKPMRLTLVFDVMIDGEEMTGHST